MPLLPARFAMPDDLGLPLGAVGHDDDTVALAQGWRRCARPEETKACEAKMAERRALAAFERGDHKPDVEVQVNGTTKFVIKTRLVPMVPLSQEDLPVEMRGSAFARCLAASKAAQAEACGHAGVDLASGVYAGAIAGANWRVDSDVRDCMAYANGAASAVNLTAEKVAYAENRLREILDAPMTEARSQTAKGLALLAQAESMRTDGMAQRFHDAFMRSILTGTGVAKIDAEPAKPEGDGLPELISGHPVWRISDAHVALCVADGSIKPPEGAAAYFKWFGASTPPEIPEGWEWSPQLRSGRNLAWGRLPPSQRNLRWSCEDGGADIVRVWLRPAAKKEQGSADGAHKPPSWSMPAYFNRVGPDVVTARYAIDGAVKRLRFGYPEVIMTWNPPEGLKVEAPVLPDDVEFMLDFGDGLDEWVPGCNMTTTLWRCYSHVKPRALRLRLAKPAAGGPGA